MKIEVLRVSVNRCWSGRYVSRPVVVYEVTNLKNKNA